MQCVNVSFDGHTNQSLNAWIQVTDGNGKDIQGWNMTLADTMQLGFVDPVQPWTPESPTLYYARMVLLDPAYPDDIYSGFDAVDFYFGFRKVHPLDYVHEFEIFKSHPLACWCSVKALACGLIFDQVSTSHWDSYCSHLDGFQGLCELMSLLHYFQMCIFRHTGGRS